MIPDGRPAQLSEQTTRGYKEAKSGVNNARSPARL